MKTLLALLALLFFSTTADAAHHRHRHHQPRTDNTKINAQVVLVFDEFNQVSMMDKNSQKIVPIASITKLMTAMVTLDANLPMDEVITIGEDDITGKLKSRMKVGMRFTRAEMLRLALMSSENRAALALAKSYPGGIEAFIPAMNLKALELEMLSTQFFDPTGLDRNNVSTAQDLVKMVVAASSYATIHEYTTTSSHELANIGRKKPLQYHNTNPLVSSSEWDIGVSKTGYISQAGRCLVMQTMINDNPVIIIILDSKTKKSRINDAKLIKKILEKQSPPTPLS